MNQTKKQAPVLVATDMGEWGDTAIREADRWAREAGAPLIVLHAISPLSSLPPWGFATGAHEGAMAQLQRTVGAALGARVTALTGRTPEDFESVTPVGTPHVEIVRAAEARDAALVVVGARGSSGLMRLLIGHSAEKVARYAHCPVLVVRPIPRSGNIVVATDLSASASVAVRKAAELARQRQAHLTALYVIDTALPFPVEGWVTPATEPSAGVLRERAGEQLRSYLASLNVTAEARVGDGFVVPSMEQLARSLPAELMVVGTVGRTGLARVVLGNTAEIAIRDLPCSVLVVRVPTTTS